MDSIRDIPSLLQEIYTTPRGSVKLIVIFDDALHPALDGMYQNLAKQTTPDSEPRAPSVASGSAMFPPTVEVCVSFDSVSVVPCRALQRAGRPPASTSHHYQESKEENIDAKVARWLSALHQQFDVMATSESSLLVSAVSQVWLQQLRKCRLDLIVRLCVNLMMV